MKSKYIGTIGGLVFSLPGLLTLISLEMMMIFMFIPILSFLPIALPLELLGNVFFDDYASTALFVLVGLTILFCLSTNFYFRSLNNDRKEKKLFNSRKLWIYLGLQFIIIHPLIFYIWASNNSDSSGDGQFIFGAFETFPISSGIFILIGIIIDLIKILK